MKSVVPLVFVLLSPAILGCMKRDFNSADKSDPNTFDGKRMRERPSFQQWGSPVVRCHQNFMHQEIFFDKAAKKFHFCTLQSTEGWSPDQEKCEELLPVAGRWGYIENRGSDGKVINVTHYQFVKPQSFSATAPRFLFVVKDDGNDSDGLYEATVFSDVAWSDLNCGTMIGTERKFDSSAFKDEKEQDVEKWHTCGQGEACGK